MNYNIHKELQGPPTQRSRSNLVGILMSITVNPCILYIMIIVSQVDHMHPLVIMVKILMSHNTSAPPPGSML